MLNPSFFIKSQKISGNPLDSNLRNILIKIVWNREKEDILKLRISMLIPELWKIDLSQNLRFSKNRSQSKFKSQMLFIGTGIPSCCLNNPFLCLGFQFRQKLQSHAQLEWSIKILGAITWLIYNSRYGIRTGRAVQNCSSHFKVTPNESTLCSSTELT